MFRYLAAFLASAMLLLPAVALAGDPPAGEEPDTPVPASTPAPTEALAPALTQFYFGCFKIAFLYPADWERVSLDCYRFGGRVVFGQPMVDPSTAMSLTVDVGIRDDPLNMDSIVAGLKEGALDRPGGVWTDIGGRTAITATVISATKPIAPVTPIATTPVTIPAQIYLAQWEREDGVWVGRMGIVAVQKYRWFEVSITGPLDALQANSDAVRRVIASLQVDSSSL